MFIAAFIRAGLMNNPSVRSSCDRVSDLTTDMRCVQCLCDAAVLIACLKFPPQRTETCASSSTRWPASSPQAVLRWRRRPRRTTEMIPCSRECLVCRALFSVLVHE